MEQHPPATSEVTPISASELLVAVRGRTPARILVGRCGPAYRTATQLTLRQDHAIARDAVWGEIDLQADFGVDFLRRWGLFEVRTSATSKQEFLMRPDLGRRLSPAGRAALQARCRRDVDLQLAIGDGLSAAAVRTQVPRLLPLVEQETVRRGWSFGQPFFLRHCRVGILNDLGAILNPAVVVLLIGERPGLATAESLSAYMAYRPRPGDTDARRNLISNIHGRGVQTEEAVQRILALAEQMRQLGMSGVGVRELLPGPVRSAALPRGAPAHEQAE